MAVRENLRYRFFLEEALVVDGLEPDLYGVHTMRGQLAVVKSVKPVNTGDKLLFINAHYSEGGGLIAVIGCDVESDGSVRPYQESVLYPHSKEKVERVKILLKGNVPNKLSSNQLSIS